MLPLTLVTVKHPIRAICEVQLARPCGDVCSLRESRRRFVYSGAPSSSQRRNRSTRSEGQAPSQGIDPSARRSAIACPFATTSAYDQRSKKRCIDPLSLSRNNGLMSLPNPSLRGCAVSMLELTSFNSNVGADEVGGTGGF